MAPKRSQSDMDNEKLPSYSSLAHSMHIGSDGKVHLDIPDDMSTMMVASIPLQPTIVAPAPSPTTPSPDPSSIPRLNILLLVIGSRGDIQPFLVLALALTSYGHRVRLATHNVFRDFVESHGIEFFDLGGSPQELMAYMVANPGLIPRSRAWTSGDIWRKRKMMREIVGNSWQACFEPSEGTGNAGIAMKQNGEKNKGGALKRSEPKAFVADAIIANPPSLAHVHCAEKLGVPLHVFFTMPWTPTSCLPHPLASIKATSKQQGQINAISYLLVESLIWQGLGSIVNNFRTKVLRLNPIHPSRAPSLLQSERIPCTYLWSESVLPRPKDWPTNASVTGYLTLDGASQYTPPKALLNFLDAGAPPVYAGFGSIVMDAPAEFLDMVVRAIHATGNRIILAIGWNRETPRADSYSDANTFVLQEDCPHDWLFPQVSCVVHHGGAGTTASGLRAGRPTVVVPFFGDQFFWGDRVFHAHAGPAPIPHEKLTVENLSEAIHFALRPDTLARAKEIGEYISSEDSTEKAVDSFHAKLPQDAYRCQLFPERAAAWRTKHTGIVLSTVAAVVLQKRRLLEWEDLELVRKFELDVAHGPYDPASGAAWAITELFIDSFRGMGEILAEVGNWPIVTHRAGERVKSALGGQTSVLPVAKRAVDGNPATPVRVRSRTKLPGEYFFQGSARVGSAAVRAPGEFTAAMANGAHDLPRLWGDKTVRAPTKITGVGSGVTAGCKELFWGVTDGITGLFVQPVTGLMREGPVGLAKGTVGGVLGLPVKWFAAASGIVGYPLKGIDVAISNAMRPDAGMALKFQCKLQGEQEYRELTEKAEQSIVNRWNNLVVEAAQR